MPIPVYIDSCAWNYLFFHGVDLAKELPRPEYSLCITREVEIELDAIPRIDKHGNSNRGLIGYIARSITQANVQTIAWFGFATYEPDGTLSKTQVFAGFDQGYWQTDIERAFYQQPDVQRQLANKESKGSGLSGNQADASMAARAGRTIILTNESPRKNGPLKLAAKLGGRIVYLEAELGASGLSLGEFLGRYPR